MEYLLTYGWALLVIVIVVAALMYLNPGKAPEQCLFQNAAFVCDNRPLLQADGLNPPRLFAKVINANPKPIVVYGLACMQGRQNLGPVCGNGGWACPDDSKYSVQIPSGQVLDYQEDFNTGSISWTSFAGQAWVECRDSSGNLLTLKAGNDFRGQLFVAYKYRDDPDAMPPKVVSADIVVRAQ